MPVSEADDKADGNEQEVRNHPCRYPRNIHMIDHLSTEGILNSLHILTYQRTVGPPQNSKYWVSY